jgi:hypothetical protein
MTQEALKMALEALTIQSDRVTEIGKQREAITAIKEALREHAMREVQRLGQEIEQEPVAMLERDPSIGRLRVTYEDAVTELDEGVYPLYTKPQGWRDNVAQAYLKGFDEASPQRTWVGLTDEDQFNLVHAMNENDWDAVQFLEAAETKLKELNT